MFPLLNCCAEAAVKRLGKFLVCLVPGGHAMLEVVEFSADVWERWKKQKPAEADRREELQALAQASAERIEAAVKAAIQAEAAGQPDAVKRMLATYLIQVQVAIRRTVCGSGDSESRTVPADLGVNSAEELLPFLPPQLPRFEPGELNSPPARTPPPRRGVPGWVWLAGGVAAFVVVLVVVVLVVRNGTGPKTPDGPPVAAKGPGGDDKPKDTDAEQKKDKPAVETGKGAPGKESEMPILDKKPDGIRPTTWKSLAGMPTARSLLAAVTGADGRIYAIGGQNASGRLDLVEVYDPSTNTWANAAPMPTARHHLAAAVGPDNLIYAIGGHSSIPKIVEAYNPSTNKWTTVAPMPTARHGLAAVTGPDGRIYAIGGNGPGRSLDTVEAYDTKSNTWTTVASMPTARVYLAAEVGPDGRIYAIGGYVENDGKRLNTVEAYDTKTNTWTGVAGMPTARNALAAATGPDGRIYAIGGHPVGENLNPAEAYDTKSNTWNAVASMPTVRGELTATTGRDGRIYVIGGGHNGSFLNTVESLIFSPSK